jgi:transcriptional regulator with XRE-family HTH domain
METIRKKFGIRIRKLRHQAGLTQEQLAESADISVDFISLIERGINAHHSIIWKKLQRPLVYQLKNFLIMNRNSSHLTVSVHR